MHKKEFNLIPFQFHFLPHRVTACRAYAVRTCSNLFCFALFCFVLYRLLLLSLFLTLDPCWQRQATSDKRRQRQQHEQQKRQTMGTVHTHTHTCTVGDTRTHTDTYVHELCCVSLTVCWCLPRFVLAFARLTQSPLLFTFLLHFTFIMLSSCIKHLTPPPYYCPPHPAFIAIVPFCRHKN